MRRSWNAERNCTLPRYYRFKKRKVWIYSSARVPLLEIVELKRTFYNYRDNTTDNTHHITRWVSVSQPKYIDIHNAIYAETNFRELWKAYNSSCSPYRRVSDQITQLIITRFKVRK